MSSHKCPCNLHATVNRCRHQARLSGVRILEGAIDLSLLENVQTSSRSHPATTQWVLRFFLKDTAARGVNLTSHQHPVTRLRMSGAIYLFPPYALTKLSGATSSFLYARLKVGTKHSRFIIFVTSVIKSINAYNWRPLVSLF